MKNQKYFITVKSIKRLANSKSGNPAFEFTFQGGFVLKTKANISDAYVVTDAMVGRSIQIETETTRSGKTQIVGIGG